MAKYITQDQIKNSPLLNKEQLHRQLGATCIIAPHPDDESLGCAGIISYLRKQNVPVWIIFMTSGEASHVNSITYPREVLSLLREAEGLEACKILDVDEANVMFLRQPDGHLHNLNSETKNSITTQLETIFRNSEIVSVVLPWRRDPHLDHIATYLLGSEAIIKSLMPIQIVEYPIWLWKNSKSQDWPVLGEVETFALDITEVQDIKHEAIFSHVSQTTNLISDDVHGFCLTNDLIEPFLNNKEYYFFNPDRNVASLEQNYFDQLYENNPDPWNFIGSDYERNKYQKIDNFISSNTYKNGLELGCSIGVQTRLLAAHCEHLLAVDISESAIDSAKRLNPDLSNVKFLQKNIIDNFPIGQYDFVSMCEVGYFFNEEALISVFQSITDNLCKNGHFLMVHWTSFVRDFPLNGRQVHRIFNDFNVNNEFKIIDQYRHESYELLLMEKL